VANSGVARPDYLLTGVQCGSIQLLSADGAYENAIECPKITLGALAFCLHLELHS